MHDLDGRTFYTLLLQQYPALRQRVIFLTADDDAADSQAFLARCGQPWLPKPCPIAVLRSTIRQVLAVAVAAPPCTQAGRTSHARSQQLAHQSQTLRTRSQGLLDKVQALYAKSTRLRTGAAVLRASYRARACHARQRSL
jgi:DNA-binding NarL/FixJ family response regulator